MARSVTAAVRAGLGSAAIPHISTKGGGFKLVDSAGKEVAIETRHLDCVIIDAVNHDHRVFWGLDAQGQPKQYEEGNFGPPVCFSDNGIGASTLAQEPQSVSCKTCPMSQFNWQSKQDASRRSTACKPLKKLAVMVYKEGGTENGRSNEIYDGDLAAQFPFVLRVPVMSLENLTAYASRFNEKIDISQVVTRVKFGDKVGRLEFDIVGRIEDKGADDDLIERVLKVKMTDVLVGRGDEAITKLPSSSQSVNEPAKPVAMPAKPSPSSLGSTPPPQEIEPITEAAPKRGRPKKQLAAPANEDERPRTAPFAAPQNGNSGIVENPPSTPEEVEASLDSLFDLPT